jgi:diguanylate cyclase (GGDEF)-like protein
MDQVFYYRGDEPAWDELEVTKANRQRIMLVIKARWMALALLAVYGLFMRVLLASLSDVNIPIRQEWMAAGAFAFVVIYNTALQMTCHWWARIKITNILQLLLDLLVITCLVHFSGGVHSWFWAMYVLITLEAAFLLENKIEVWTIGACGSLLYGALLFAEYLGVIPQLVMPFEEAELHRSFIYETINWAWVSVLNGAVALIGTHLVGVVHERQTELERLGVRDGLTGLYNRRYFYHRLRGEIERCRRYTRQLSLLMIDVDNFKIFNDRYGHLEGDHVLKSLGTMLQTSVRHSESPPTYELDIACRYGGEEFVIILPETEAVDAVGVAERIKDLLIANAAVVTAERIRTKVASTAIRGRSVTVSIGVSTYPGHGESADDLVRSADEALYSAKGGGRNRVVLAPFDEKPADLL